MRVRPAPCRYASSVSVKAWPAMPAVRGAAVRRVDEDEGAGAAEARVGVDGQGLGGTDDDAADAQVVAEP